MEKLAAKEAICNGKTYLGIELGSTRIKAVLVGDDYIPMASGSHEWENKLVDNIWTYSLEDIWGGIQDCYQDLAKDVKAKYDEELTTFGSIGFSAMMHGYMVFDKDGKQLVPFRTWRNTITGEAADALTELFQFNIPQRWSIAHLYQAILKGEAHVPYIDYMTTLEGYVHWMLTGERILGIGDCAGMFPIDGETKKYNKKMVDQFDALIADKKFPWKLLDIMPKEGYAGENAGTLTAEGAKLLDPSGKLQPGIPMCPPEGDAGTGMVATNSVGVRTCNVSAGTSVFAMAVLEKDLSELHRELDMVTTPDGAAVAMVHCNNCTSDLNAWVGLFEQFLGAMGVSVDKNKLYETLYKEALKADSDCGNLVAYNYFSGEHITHFEEGRPLFVRMPDSKFTLANFMRTHLFTAMGALKIGMDILNAENVSLDKVVGHGGLFKTEEVGQRFMAAAMGAPVTVMETAGEGGAWGCALLAAYMQNKAEGETLAQFLDNKVFAGAKGITLAPKAEDVESFETFMKGYRAGLAVEAKAVEALR